MRKSPGAEEKASLRPRRRIALQPLGNPLRSLGRSRHHRHDLSIDPTSGHGLVIGYQGLTDPKAIDSVNRVDGTMIKQ